MPSKGEVEEAMLKLPAEFCEMSMNVEDVDLNEGWLKNRISYIPAWSAFLLLCAIKVCNSKTCSMPP